MKNLVTVSILAAAVALTGCGGETFGAKSGKGIGTGGHYMPVVDTGTYTAEEKAKYDVDLQQCQALAKEVHDNRKSELAGKVVVGAVAGAVVGGLIGGIAGDQGRNTMGKAGAVYGAGIGGASGAQTLLSTKDITIKCIQGRGHTVLQ